MRLVPAYLLVRVLRSATSCRALLILSLIAHTSYATDAAPSPPTSSSAAVVGNLHLSRPVPTDGLVGVSLPALAFDEQGYTESDNGLLVIELDPKLGPVTSMRSFERRPLDAQFVHVERDAVWLAREGPVVDRLPSGITYEVPYGYGALRHSRSVTTVLEAPLEPHVSDDVVSYDLFPLDDVYLGGEISLTGIRAELRFVDRERYVVFAQAGLNVPALAGLGINRTYGGFAVPFVVGAALRYPAPLTGVGTNWSSGVEMLLGLIDIDERKDTAAVIALPGLFHEVEWNFQRDVDTQRSDDAKPHGYGRQAVFVKLGAHPDFLGGATNGLLVDFHLGYRFNVGGPTIPSYPRTETKVTYASDSHVQRERQASQPGLNAPSTRSDSEARPNAAPPNPAPPNPAPPKPAPPKPAPSF